MFFTIRKHAHVACTADRTSESVTKKRVPRVYMYRDSVGLVVVACHPLAVDV